MGVCPRCGCAIALHEGRPHVTENGAVQLWHQSCWSVRHARPVEVVAVIAPQPRFLPRALAGGAAIALVAVALVPAVQRRLRAPTASLASIDLADEPSPLAIRGISRDEAPPPAQPAEARFPVPLENGAPIDEVFPSLREWAHPVADTHQQMPEQQSRWFGAERSGLETIRAECGAGHCGVDLDGPRGQPIVAVADGVVVRVERHEFGLDGRSGRYVRIEHDDGTLTAYMHLDDIAEGLDVGDFVEAGQMIGTLGATAVYSAAPHLHFSLEVPRHPGEHHGDHADTHYVDPAPFLVRATVVPAPDRRHARKPAM
jgi:murein DD-endopeptidase MepM/ murein hydrolase activator NlpD